MNRFNGTREKIDLTLGYERKGIRTYDYDDRLIGLGVPKGGIMPEDISLSEEDREHILEYLEERH